MHPHPVSDVRLSLSQSPSCSFDLTCIAIEAIDCIGRGRGIAGKSLRYVIQNFDSKSLMKSDGQPPSPFLSLWPTIVSIMLSTAQVGLVYKDWFVRVIGDIA